MLQNINLSQKPSNSNSDAMIAKNIIDLLFAFTDKSVRNDKNMSLFAKQLILTPLPGVRDGSKNYVDKMGSTVTKKLLDDIENQLKNRK